MPCFGVGGAPEDLKMICTATPALSPVRAFPNCRELAVLTFARHSFGSTNDQVDYPNGMEFCCAILEPCDQKFLECLSQEGITLNEGEEIESFLEGCVVESFFEGGKTMGVECYSNGQHSFWSICQHEWCLPRGRFFSRTD